MQQGGSDDSIRHTPASNRDSCLENAAPVYASRQVASLSQRDRKDIHTHTYD